MRNVNVAALGTIEQWIYSILIELYIWNVSVYPKHSSWNHELKNVPSEWNVSAFISVNLTVFDIV